VRAWCQRTERACGRPREGRGGPRGANYTVRAWRDPNGPRSAAKPAERSIAHHCSASMAVVSAAQGWPAPPEPPPAGLRPQARRLRHWEAAAAGARLHPPASCQRAQSPGRPPSPLSTPSPTTAAPVGQPSRLPRAGLLLARRRQQVCVRRRDACATGKQSWSAPTLAPAIEAPTCTGNTMGTEPSAAPACTPSLVPAGSVPRSSAKPAERSIAHHCSASGAAVSAAQGWPAPPGPPPAGLRTQARRLRHWEATAVGARPHPGRAVRGRAALRRPAKLLRRPRGETEHRSPPWHEPLDKLEVLECHAAWYGQPRRPVHAPRVDLSP